MARGTVPLLSLQGKPSVKILARLAVAVAVVAGLAVPSSAQSPNTSTVVVLVTDQSGGVIKDAQVSITNTQTGKAASATSAADGRATFPALSLTGSYTLSVSKGGFGPEERTGITLRAGETATIRVRLLVGAEKAEVTVFGTNQGVRADAQIGQRLDSTTIDEIPIPGRKITTLPLYNSAF